MNKETAQALQPLFFFIGAGLFFLFLGIGVGSCCYLEKMDRTKPLRIETIK